MFLGNRIFIDGECGRPLKDPIIGFLEDADFLRYTNDLHDKIFHISWCDGNERELIRPQLCIRDITDDTYKDDCEYEFHKSTMCPVFGETVLHLRYFEFVDFLIEWRKIQKKLISFDAAIMMRESLFDSFAYEKFEW